jgi:hypothetical protein
LIASFTPLRYPRPYPATQAPAAQAAIKSQVRPLGIVHAMCMVARPGELTNSGSNRPNASSPSGPANDRDANPNRSLDAPALSRGGLRIGKLWPGQAEPHGPRQSSGLPTQRVSQLSSAFQPPSRTGCPNYARERLTQPERAQG